MGKNRILITAALTVLVMAFQNCGLESPTGDQSSLGNANNSSTAGNSNGDTTAPTTTPTTTPTPTPTATVVPQDKAFTTANATPVTFDVPQYSMISIKVWGGGGGGGSAGGAGGNGLASKVVTTAGTLTAGGGLGGGKSQASSGFTPAVQGAGGGGGSATGGSINTKGNDGNSAMTVLFGAHTGGAGGVAIYALAGVSRGTGGNGGNGSGETPGGGGGGSGGYTEIVYVYPTLSVGSQLQITVGAGGTAGISSLIGLVTIPGGSPGSVGRVEISVR